MGTTKRKVMGRPRVPQPRRPALVVRINDTELALLREAANGYPVSTWARVTLLAAARAATKKGGR